MLQITRSGAVFSGSAEAVEHLRARFNREFHVRLPALFEPALLQLICHRIEEGEFREKTHEGIGKEQCLPDNCVASCLLNFLLNGSQLFQVVQAITQCERIGAFSGRVYRLLAHSGYGDSWHDDRAENRMVAVSVNLSTQPYSGGVLQIRDRKSPQDLQEVVNTGFGDAVMFRLAPHLEHRVTDVEGRVPRTAFAGWFVSQPDYLSLLKSPKTA